MKYAPFESVATGTSVLHILASMLSGYFISVCLFVEKKVPPTLKEIIVEILFPSLCLVTCVAFSISLVIFKSAVNPKNFASNFNWSDE